MWVPVTYGTYYEEGRDKGIRRPHPCPLKPGTKRCLQLRPFTASVLTITFTDATPMRMGAADPRPAGYKFFAHARAAYEVQHGAATAETQIWVARFEVGDLTPAYEAGAERYLRSKMGGGRDYTTNPEQAAHGEQAVPRESEMKFACDAAIRREAESAKAVKRLHGRLYAAVTEIEGAGVDLSPSAREEVRWLRRRVKRIEEELRGETASAA